ncbi:Transcription factor AP-4 [Anthophora retusa]
MSVFGGEDRILLEEIVETTEEQETNLCGSIGIVEEGSVTTSVTVAEVADSQEQQQQQSKSNGVVSRRVAGQNVALSNGNSTSNVSRVTPRSHMEQEKRMRREIANSNERRRMQSINAGFQSLRTLLPHHEGEKLSKVSYEYHKIVSFFLFFYSTTFTRSSLFYSFLFFFPIHGIILVQNIILVSRRKNQHEKLDYIPNNRNVHRNAEVVL